MLLNALLVGLRTLANNPLRTFLSTLGVIIGTAALVAVLALGDGVERYARQQIASQTDLQLFSVSSETRRRVDGISLPRPDTAFLTTTSLVELGAVLGPGVELTLARAAGSLVDGLPGDSPRGVMVRARAGAPGIGASDSLVAGRDLTATEASGSEPLALISVDLARLFGSATEAIDRTVILSGAPFTVIGVAGAPGDDEPTLSVRVPYDAWSLAVPVAMQSPATVLGRTTNIDDMPGAVAAAREWAERTGGNGLTVSNRNDMLVEVRRGMLVAKLLMGSITGISLIVGGIGIMNVLLASVIERTREIGIRRATGATRRDILSQFLAESVVITGAGSLAGLVLGILGAFGVSWLMRAQSDAPVHAAFTPLPIVVAALSAVLIGLVFGMYPALKAARLAPIEAIRTE